VRMLIVDRTCRYDKYEVLVCSDDSLKFLWKLMSKFRLKIRLLLKAVLKDESCLDEAIFVVDSNLYIGSSYSNFTFEQCLALKDDSQYFFRTTKQGFVDLAWQLIDVLDQNLDGIYIEEVATDYWQLKAMTWRELKHYRILVKHD